MGRIRNRVGFRACFLACGLSLATGVGPPLRAQEPAPQPEQQPAAQPAPQVSSATRPQDIANILSLDIDALTKVPVSISPMAPVASVITASKYVQPIDESPMAINVLTAADIQRSGAKTLADLLRRFPGVWSWTKTRSDMDIGMMGLMGDDTSEVLYLLDGQPMGSPPLGGMQWPQFPITLEDVERVEVLRGGGSALYGANAYAGMINIITKPTRDRKTTIRTYSGENGIENQTFTFARTYDQLSYYVTGGWRQTQQQGPFEPVFNLGEMNYYRTPVLNARAEYQFSEGRKATWFMGYSNGPGGYPASPGDESIDGVTDWVYFVNQGQYFHTISEDTTFDIKGEYYDAYQRNTRPYQAGSPEKYRVYSQRYYGEWNLLTRRVQNHTFLAGMAYEYLLANSVGTISNLAPGRLHTYQMIGTYLQDDWHLTDRLSFVPAVRYDYYDDVSDEFNPRGTLMYDLNENNMVRGSIGRSYRRTSIYGMYYEVTWPGGYYRGGGPGLPARNALNYEFEYRSKITPDYTFKMEYSHSRLGNMSTEVITYPGPKIEFRASDHIFTIDTLIWELEGTPIKDVLKWYANMTFYDGRDITANVYMVDIPSSMFNIGFQYQPTEKLYVTMDGHQQNGFRAVESGQIPMTGLPPDTSVPSFFSVDAKIGYFLTKNAEIGLSAENLFNDRHWEYPLCLMRSRTLYAECRVAW